jgi:two-component system alkaline phosphatase synthesis response regulator PhoP
MKILLVEDEKEIQRLIKINLELDGYEVHTADNGQEAMNLINSQYYDLLVLDIMLPYISGYDICNAVKEKSKETKVIILSANGDPEFKILGLKLGADDYMAKPFHLEELLLRVKLQLKEKPLSKNETPVIYRFGQNEINFESYIATTKDGIINLTAKEVELLRLLIGNENSVVTRDEILSKVWGYDVVLETRTMDNMVVGFRKKFEKDSKTPIHFKTVRGVGYKFCKS